MNLIILLLLIAIAELTAVLAIILKDKTGLTGRKTPRRKVFVDTSILIDGRILSVARAGFLGDELLIPRSVIRELQLLADGSDSEKRTRARFGLDVVNELERVELADVKVFSDKADSPKVDERLIELAKSKHGMIMTNDYNLAKVAATEHIDVITINNLAQGLRSEYLPGDRLTVTISMVGSGPKQGIAHLADGTMIVVDDAERYAGTGQHVDIVFERYLQTSAGRMMFAKLAQKEKRGSRRNKTSKNRPSKK
ncbi:hypothetical protein IIY67_02805 [Candidatus Saccharibacteria bacterium]|nr:hypothetical protein [Candidatus Saccharibacteria bacterium]